MVSDRTVDLQGPRRSVGPRGLVVATRIAWTVVSAAVVQAIVCLLAVLPVAVIWSRLLAMLPPDGAIRLFAISGAVIPSYLLFSLVLMPVSAFVMRLTGWRTMPGVEMRIADMDWRLLDWARAMIGTHLVRFFSGALFRGTPIWTAYLRMAGARMGRRVYVNSLGVSDYNLLEFGDGVVIGADVHLSGHTVEKGVVKTAPVTLGRNVTIGLCSIIDIGVEIGDDAQVGAMSLVPKHTRLESGFVYAGVPAKLLETP
jgi:serine acetyltransferase